MKYLDLFVYPKGNVYVPVHVYHDVSDITIDDTTIDFNCSDSKFRERIWINGNYAYDIRYNNEREYDDTKMKCY